MPGVVKVFTAADFAGVGGIPCGWQVTDRFGKPMQEPKHPVLADGKVRHVGDPIAVVVADTLEEARDAGLLIGKGGLYGNVIRITDVGPTGFGSLWCSDGTKWRTLTGRQLLSSNRIGTSLAALAEVFTANTKFALPAAPMVSSGAILLPAGLLSVGAGLAVSALIRHAGTAGSWMAQFRIGTANAYDDAVVGVVNGAATTDQAAWMFQEMNITASTAFWTAYNMKVD